MVAFRQSISRRLPTGRQVKIEENLVRLDFYGYASIVPAVAPVIALGGYPALFPGGAAVGIIGAVLITRIKGVK